LYTAKKVYKVKIGFMYWSARRTCSELETGTEELCEIKGDYHIVGMTA
jgi:hypothetical protein